mgnify:CR=1 FL=1|jgi:hypothetical protein
MWAWGACSGGALRGAFAASRVRQVVTNLPGNATRYTEAGSITLSLRKVGDAVELAMADTGIGICADDLRPAPAKSARAPISRRSCQIGCDRPSSGRSHRNTIENSRLTGCPTMRRQRCCHSVRSPLNLTIDPITRYSVTCYEMIRQSERGWHDSCDSTPWNHAGFSTYFRPISG